MLEARIQQYMNRELLEVKAEFRKAEEPEIKLPTFIRSWRNQGSYRKNNIYFCFTDYGKVCDSEYKNKQNTMNKASGCDGIPVELFQILTDDAVKVLHPICQQIWRTQQWP